MTVNGLKSHDTEEIPAIPASTLHEGSIAFDLAAGEKVKVDGPSGTERFEAEVPAGKKWEVSVRFSIIETAV